MSIKKDKIYASSLITSDIKFGTPDGPVRLYIDENKRLSIDLDDNSGQTKSIQLDPINNKINVENVEFRDGSTISLVEGKIPSDKIPEIVESKLSSDIRTKLNSTAAAVDSYFDENGKLKENNAPTDYATIRINASNGNTARGFFDENGILNNNKLPDVTITTTNFGTNFDTAFSGKNPITSDNFGTNFDTAFAGKNPVTDNNFSSKFNTEFDNNVPNGYNNWSELATAATNGNTARGYFDNSGILDITKAPSSLKNSEVSFSLDGQTITFNNGTDNIISLGSGNVGLGNVANESPTQIRSGITIDSTGAIKGIGAGVDTIIGNNKITIDGPTGKIQGIGTADVVVDNDKFSITTDSTTGVISFNKGIGQPITSNPFGSTKFIEVSGVANTAKSTADSASSTATTVRGYFDQSGILEIDQAPDGLKNSQVSFGLAGQTITFNNGTESTITLDSGNVGLSNVANESPTQIRSGITIDGDGKLQGIGTGVGTVIGNNKITVNGTTGKLQGIGTADVVVNNNLIGLSRDATTGEITLDKGVGTTITVNPFTSTRFTEVSGVVNTANSTANTVRGFFNNDSTPQLNDSNTPAGLKNSQISLSLTSNGVLSLNNAAQGDVTFTKSTVGLDQVDNLSSSSLLSKTFDDNRFQTVSGSARDAIFSGSSAYSDLGSLDFSVSNGEISLTLGSRGTAVTSINKASIGLDQVDNLSSSSLLTKTFDDTRFQNVSSSAFSGSEARGFFNTSGILDINKAPAGLKNANVFTDTKFLDVSSSASSGSEARGFFNTQGILDINKAPNDLKNANVFTDTRWEEVSSSASSGSEARGYFDTSGILDINKAPAGLKNANVFSDTRWEAVSGSARDAIFSGSSAYDDLGNLDFSVSNGEISLSLGNRGTASTSISKTSIGLGSVENYSLSEIKTATFTDTNFTDITDRFTGGILNTSNLPTITTSKLDAGIVTSLGKADTVRGFFNNDATPKLNSSNTPDNLKNSQISLSLSGGALSLVGAAAGNVNFTKSTVGLSNVANESPATIRSGITVDDDGIIQGIGTSNIPVNINKVKTNSLVSSSNISLIGNTAKKTGGTTWDEQVYSKDGYTGGAYFSVVWETGSLMVGLNTDPTTNASYSSLDYAWHINGSNAGIRENNNTIVFNNLASITSGDIVSITYDGSYIRYFLNGEVKRTVSVSITNKLFFDSSFGSDNSSISNIQFGPMSNISEALNTANTANITANTVRGFFNNDATPQLKDSNTPAGLKNSQISLSLTNDGRLSLNNAAQGDVTFTKSTVGLSAVENKSSQDIRDEITVDATTGKLEGIGTADVIVNNNLVTKTSIGLGNVENQSPATIRNGITVDENGVLQGIGTDGIAVKNSLITKTSLGLGSVENYSLAQIKTATFTDSNFTSISNRFTGGILNTANLPTIGLSKLDTSVTQSLAKADTINGFFESSRLKSSNLPNESSGFKFANNKLVIGASGAQYSYNNNENETYDDYTDLEVVGPNSSTPDIGLLKTGTSSGVLGYLYFKGYDGTNTNHTVYGGTYNALTGWSLSGIVSLPDYTPRAAIRAYGYNTGASRLYFQTCAASAGSALSYRMTIDENGRVGINNTSPSYTLDVSGDINATGDVRIGDQIQFASYAAVSNRIIIRTDNNNDRDQILIQKQVTVGTVNHYAKGAITFNEDSNNQFYYIRFRIDNGHHDSLGMRACGYIKGDGNNTKLNFTGQHRNISDNLELYSSNSVGLIVCSEGTYLSMGNNSITINEALPKVLLSNKRNQKSVFGVISDKEDENSDSRIYETGNFVSEYIKPQDDNRLIINSLGEGGIWVTNINGNLENGDYITTCEIPGYGMKQDDDLLHNYTVAKITCDCDFDLQSPIFICEEFEWEGQVYRRAFVGCTYHCG